MMVMMIVPIIVIMIKLILALNLFVWVSWKVKEKKIQAVK